MPRKLVVAKMGSRPDKPRSAPAVNPHVPCRPAFADQSGFTLVEVMVAALILLTGVLGTLTLLDGANAATSRTKSREAATNLARELIESARAVPYPELVTPKIAAAMREQPGLDDVDGDSDWHVRRRNVLFTITATACSVDDDKATGDGLGDHTGGYFCNPGATTGPDENPDDYKRVAFDVTWTDGSTSRTVRQEAVINNPGDLLAPGIKTLTKTAPTVDPITTDITSVTFQATTTSVPDRVRWSVDNVDKGAATGSAFTWNFTWTVGAVGTNPPVDDGTYLIGAQAYNQFDQSGTARTRTVVLNRFAPRSPTGFVAGRNGAVGVEFEWHPNTEPDVSGYRVYRVTGAAPSAADQVVCSTRTTETTPTSCRDKEAPAAPAALRYYVVAIAPARPPATGDEASARPTSLDETYLVSNSNVAPNEPTSLTATAPADGTVNLAWSAPQPPSAGEPGDTVRYYRIYRDGDSYADRYDRTGAATEHSFVDVDPGPGTHTYSVTTVDSQLAESAPITITGIGP
jgi:prepilin-type N-terminal cleavage/methylation domain-containing protein